MSDPYNKYWIIFINSPFGIYIDHCFYYNINKQYIERVDIMSVHDLIAPILRFFRQKRMSRFISIFRPGPDTQILDSGGTPFNWKLINCSSKITLLNLYKGSLEKGYPNLNFEAGDATNLPYPDNSFDIAYSNSVIEHLFTYEQQKKFAQEIRRVGKNIWVQTPARSFFLEPHFFTPLIHFIPLKVRKKLAPYSIRALLDKQTREFYSEMAEEIRLLSYSEMKELFPDCNIIRERFLGFTKCFIAVRKAV